MDKKAEMDKMIWIILGLVIGVIILLVLFGIWKKLACIFLPQLC